MKGRVLKQIGLALAVVVMLGALSALASRSPSAGPPEWFSQHVARMTAEGGRWIADNSEWKSAAEPWEAYGLEWERGIGGASMRGRLFQLQDGEERGDAWELRLFWHPGEQRAVLCQYGADGTYGAGPLEIDGDGSEHVEQVFYAPDGAVRTTRHESWMEGAAHLTRSLDKVGAEWKPNRTYVWERSTR